VLPVLLPGSGMLWIIRYVRTHMKEKDKPEETEHPSRSLFDRDERLDGAGDGEQPEHRSFAWRPLVVVAVLIAVGVVALAIKKDRSSPVVTAVSVTQSGVAIPKLVDLGAGKCIPCKMMAPILDELKKEYQGRFDVELIDVWEDPEAGRRYRIRLIPTQIFFDASGKELYRHEGFLSKEDILNKWKELGIALEKEASREETP